MLFDIIKTRVGIHESIKVYDEEIKSLIDYAKYDMVECGVPEDVIERETAPVVNCIAMFVRQHRAGTEEESERYRKLYERCVFRLAIKEG